MSVTELQPQKNRSPYVSSWSWYFELEDEAHMFHQGVRDDLAEQEHVDYVDFDVDYVDEAGSWRLVVRYIDRRPDPSRPLAA